MDLEEMEWRVWIGLIWLKVGTDGGSCEHGDEPPSSINGREFLD
jgi:hypothetical protein